MKEREEGGLDPRTLDRDMQLLRSEITFAEARVDALRERCAPASVAAVVDPHVQAFEALLGETEQELFRLYNARQFLAAEKMIAAGVPREEVIARLQG